MPGRRGTRLQRCCLVSIDLIELRSCFALRGLGTSAKPAVRLWMEIEDVECFARLIGGQIRPVGVEQMSRQPGATLREGFFEAKAVARDLLLELLGPFGIGMFREKILPKDEGLTARGRERFGIREICEVVNDTVGELEGREDETRNQRVSEWFRNGVEASRPESMPAIELTSVCEPERIVGDGLVESALESWIEPSSFPELARSVAMRDGIVQGRVAKVDRDRNQPRRLWRLDTLHQVLQGALDRCRDDRGVAFCRLVAGGRNQRGACKPGCGQVGFCG